MTTVNDETRKQIASTTEQLSERITDVQSSLGDEIRKDHQETSAQLGELLSRVDTYRKPKRWWQRK